MRHLFWSLWAALLLLKLAFALHVPLFVDEGFYWLEARHPAAAYSDLPALTAWLVRIGEAVGGTQLLGIRWPFLLLGALVPLQVLAIARAAGLAPAVAWRAGLLALLLPLGGTLGLFALPDVPLVVATLLCVQAVLRLVQRIDMAGVALLAAGLVLGGLAHYRFLASLGAGLLALCWVPAGRRVFTDLRVWVAIGVGALAWWPVLAWNQAHDAAGWRFQLLERHPWQPHADGWLFVLVQPLVVTPLLALALLAGMARGAACTDARQRVLAMFGITALGSLFLLGFVTDNERLSLHWPLGAELALLPLASAWLQARARGWRAATPIVAAIGLATLFAYCLLLALPGSLPSPLRAKWYPANFAGWDTLVEAVQQRLPTMPPRTRLVAGDFKIAAQLGFALDDPGIPVLPHVLNIEHGRQAQLAAWEQLAGTRAVFGDWPLLLVVEPASVKPSQRSAYAAELCAWAGALPEPEEVLADEGRRRFLLYRLPAGPRTGGCAGFGPGDAPGG